jgi:hypothetical protein
MPTQERRRRHDPDPPQFAREQPSQRRQHHSVLRLQPRPAHLSSQYRHLMPQDHQLNILRRLAPGSEGQPSQGPPARPHTQQRRPSADHAERRSAARAEVIEPHRCRAVAVRRQHATDSFPHQGRCAFGISSSWQRRTRFPPPQRHDRQEVRPNARDLYPAERWSACSTREPTQTEELTGD